MTIKFSEKNEGRPMKIRGKEQVVDKVLANKEKFRVKQGAGEVVLDFDINDIEEAEGIIIDIVP